MYTGLIVAHSQLLGLGSYNSSSERLAAKLGTITSILAKFKALNDVSRTNDHFYDYHVETCSYFEDFKTRFRAIYALIEGLELA